MNRRHVIRATLAAIAGLLLPWRKSAAAAKPATRLIDAKTDGGVWLFHERTWSADGKLIAERRWTVARRQR